MGEILREVGITRQVQDYKRKLVLYGYLSYDTDTAADRTYALTPESAKTATITIEVKPSLYAEEVRRHLVEMLAPYGDIIAVSEVEL